MKANIWGKEINCCTNCDYCSLHDGYFSYYLCNKIHQEVIDDTIHSDCSFIQPIEDLKEIDHYRYSHLKEIKIEENKLIQIFKHKHLDNVFQIEIYESRDNKTIKNVWYNIQTIDNIKIHNPEHLKFILNSIL